MQRKPVAAKASKTSRNLKARLKPISLEEPLTNSPFLTLIENEPPKTAEMNVNQPIESGGQGNLGGEPDKQNVESQNFAQAATAVVAADELPPRAAKPKREFESSIAPQNESNAAEVESHRAQSLPRSAAAIAPRKLCRLLEVDELDDIFSLSDLLKASSLKLYAAFVELADKNGRLKIKAHELMRAAGIKGIATFYKQERWLIDLGLLEKRAKPGPHEGSSYRVYSLDSLPVNADIIAEFNRFVRSASE